jgi:cobyric acid synthase
MNQRTPWLIGQLADCPPRLVFAAPQGRSGKTTVAVGLCAALQSRGIIVQPFKPRIVSLRAQAEAIRQTKVTKTLARLTLAPEQQQAIDALATSLTNKLLYAATHAIRN